MKKVFWWILCILWATPEFIYMFFTKKVSKVAQFLFNKVMK
jgi:hypothetical protein